MKRNFKKNRGITLVALIITIIVMLILVAVSVNILIKSNLLGVAEKTTTKYKADTENEANMETIEIGGKQYNSIEEYLKTKNNNNNDNTDKKTYTVRFCDYDGTLLQSISVEEGSTAEYTLSEPTGKGEKYKFDKWVTSKNGNIKADLTNISSNLEVYARYALKEVTTTEIAQVKSLEKVFADGTTEEMDKDILEITDNSEEISNILETLKNTNKTFKEYFNSESEINSLNFYEYITLTINDNELGDNDLLVKITLITKYAPGSTIYGFLKIEDGTNDPEWFEIECEAEENRRFKFYYTK